MSGTKDKTLPQEVLNLLPRDDTRYPYGSNVTAVKPSKTKVEVSGGVWEFKGYDKNEILGISADGTFLGTWEFTENQEPDSSDSDGGSSGGGSSHTSTPAAPHTGDNSGIALWAALTVLAGTGLAGLGIYRKKKRL